jgi:hypothetical protein
MLRCDFCGKDAERVARVALAEGYDRLTERHVKKYACADCSKKKEEARTGKKEQDAKG